MELSNSSSVSISWLEFYSAFFSHEVLLMYSTLLHKLNGVMLTYLTLRFSAVFSPQKFKKDNQILGEKFICEEKTSFISTQNIRTA